ncbi:MAG: carbohydrate porin [Planctomycetota bacterium]|jgi:porin
MEKLKLVCALVIVLVGLLVPVDALAEDDPDEWAGFAPEGEYDPVEFTGLTGDWNGQRTKLAERGITIDIDVIQTYQGVVDGGTDSSWEYGGTAEYNFQFDFQKLGLWPGAFVHGRAKQQYGEFVNNNTGAMVAANFQGLLPLPDYDGVAVPQFVFTQFLSESLAVFLGKIDTTEGDSTRFSGARGKDNFMNQAFVLNAAAVRGLPLSALGGGLLFIWPDARAEKPTTLSVSILGPDGQPNTAGWDDDFEDGTSYSVEFRRPTQFFGKDGAHTFAGVYSDKDFTILDQDPGIILPPGSGPLEENDGTWAFYYNFDQYLFNEEEDPTQGFGLFGRFGIADDETNPADTFYSIGLGGKGIIEGRDEDTFGVGYYYLKISDELPKVISNRSEDTQGFEVFYNIEATPWLHITPDFQIIDPAQNVDTAYVAGVRVRVDF